MGAAVKTDVHISHPDGAARTLAFTQPLIRIGRVEALQGARNDIVLSGDGVSKEHAHLVVGDDGITVVDRSRNGTFVNGVLVRQPHRLQPGEAVEIDRYVLRCSAAPASPAPAPVRAGLEIELVPNDDLEFVPPEDELPRFDGSEQPFDPPHDDLLGDLPPDDPDDLPPANPVRRDEHPTPAQPPHPRDEPPRDPLAAAYHALAAEFGAAAWGDPPRAAAWSSALAAARRITAQHPSLAGDPVWPEWLAREVCGVGPLTALLDDTTVTAITVHGAGPIEVRRGEAHERAAARFSCPEALAATFARWTGERLEGDADVTCALPGGVSLTALGTRLAPAGPVLHLVRPRPALPLGASAAEPALPPAAVDLLTAAVRRGLGIIVFGDANAALTPLAAGIAAAIPDDRSVALVARTATWPTIRAVVLHGFHPHALRRALRLHVDWILLEEVHTDDAADLCAAARHPGGGLVCTLRARSAESALARLAAMVAATTDADPIAARASLAHCFDLLVDVRHTGGRSRVHAIAELRPGGRGELAELFTLKPDSQTLESTHVDCHALR